MSKPDLRLPAAILLIVASLAACGPSPTSAGPSERTSPSTSTPASTASPTPGAEAPEPTTPTACLTLGQTDCLRAAAAAVDALVTDEPPPIYLQVGPFGCRVGERCATTLAARPAGDVLVEFAAAPAVSIHLALAADGSLTATRGEASGIVVASSSTPLGQFGPIPFTLGHCGLYSGVDIDGSWWDPVGIIDADHGDSINAATGVLAFDDPNHARFASNGGLIVQLLRRDGPKHLPFCQ